MSDNTDVFHYDGLEYWGPISRSTMESVLDLIDVAPGARALDIGCGRGELLLRLIERYQVSAVGVDKSPGALEQLRSEHTTRTPDAALELIEEDVHELGFDDESFDIVCWLGGPYIGEDFETTLSRLAALTRPGGYVLVGHGFWVSDPPLEYLAATGIDASELGEHWETIELGASVGLTPLHCCRSSLHEWDRFEGTILRNVEVYAAAHPDAPDPQGRLEQRRSWHRAQQRWGRDVMGFGLYLFLR